MCRPHVGSEPINSMLSPRLLNIPKHLRQRTFSTDARATDLRRSYLYVPSSSDSKLNKSLSTSSDVIIYDLEDSVPPSPADKTAARTQLSDFLLVCTRKFSPSHSLTGTTAESISKRSKKCRSNQRRVHTILPR